MITVTVLAIIAIMAIICIMMFYVKLHASNKRATQAKLKKYVTQNPSFKIITMNDLDTRVRKKRDPRGPNGQKINK